MLEEIFLTGRSHLFGCCQHHPTPRPVVEAMNDYFYHYNANTGRGAYGIANKASQKLEEARTKMARFVNSQPDEIILTKNTTEAINLVAHSLKMEKGITLWFPTLNTTLI